MAERHIPSCAKAIKRPNPVGGKRPGKASPASADAEQHAAERPSRASKEAAGAPAPPSATPVKQRPSSGQASPSKVAVARNKSPATTAKRAGTPQKLR